MRRNNLHKRNTIKVRLLSGALMLCLIGSMQVTAHARAVEDGNSIILMVGKLGEYFKDKGTRNNAYYARVIGTLDENDREKEKELFPMELKLKELVEDKKRIDTGREFLDEILQNNDRLEYYDLYLQLAKREGYIITTYEDYLTKYSNTDKKVLILRHDIDVPSEGTKLMFEIEKKNGVKATYYFRWLSFDRELIREISNAGFEVGLHYETIATYCEDKHKRTIDPEELNTCRNILKQEIKEFEQRAGVDVKTVASHGHPLNRKIGIPNWVLFEGQKYSDFGLIGETYDAEVLKKLDSYICDADLMKRYGFSYKANPLDSILAGKRVIEFLSHPNHWFYSVYDRARMTVMLDQQSEASSRENPQQPPKVIKPVKQAVPASTKKTIVTKSSGIKRKNS